MTVLDPNAPEIIARLKSENFEYLYHFTCIENIPGLSKQNAICSKEYLDSCGEWPVPKPGGNTWSHDQDRRHNNWGLIATSLTPQTQMFYWRKSEEHFCFFLISLNVSGWKDVIFTDTNSAKNGHIRRTGLEGLDIINFKMVRAPYLPQNEDWHKYHMAEVLVPNRIPMEFVSKVAFVSEVSLREAEILWGDNDHPKFIIDRTFFQNIPEPLSRNTGFSYVSKIILTDSDINRRNYRTINTHMTKFQRKKGLKISAVIKINALAGTRGKVIWSPNNSVSEIEFPNSKFYTWWPNIPIEDLPNGKNILQVKINDIIWSNVEFEVIP